MKACTNFSADSMLRYFLTRLILFRWKKALLQVLVMLKFRPGLLKAWLVLTSVKYHGNLYILIPLNQRLALTRLRATGLRLKWQSNQAPKFLRDSVQGEMMDSPIVIVALLIFCSFAFVPVSINSVLESLIMSLSLIIQLRMSQRHASIAAMAASWSESSLGLNAKSLVSSGRCALLDLWNHLRFHRHGWLSFPHFLIFAPMTNTHRPHQHFQLLSFLAHPNNA